MLKYIYIAFSFIFLTTATSCGISKTGNTSSEIRSQNSVHDLANFRQSIAGKWYGSCVVSTSAEPSSTMIIMEFKANQVSYAKQTFNDLNCQFPRRMTRYTGSTRPTAYSKNISGQAYIVELIYNKFFLNEFESEIIEANNDMKLCGFSDWSVGREKQLTGNMTDCGIAVRAENAVMKSSFTPTISVANGVLRYYDSDSKNSLSFIGQQ